MLANINEINKLYLTSSLSDTVGQIAILIT